MIRLAICDDHPLVARAVAAALGDFPEFRLTVEAASGQALIRKLRATPCDMVLLDFSMPGELDGIGLIEYLGRAFPEVRVVVLSAMASPELIERCMQAGARGFMQKSLDPALLVQGLIKVARGVRHVDAPHVPAMPFDKAMLKLSPREMVVVRLLLSGASVSTIAIKLCKSIKTISTQKQSAYRKLGVSNDAALFQMASGRDMLPGSTLSQVRP